MAIYNTHLIRFSPEIPYMTPAETVAFKRLREGGALSMFRCTSCENCQAEIPKNKRFCSKKCFEIKEGTK